MTLLTTSLLDTKSYPFSALRYIWESQVVQSGVVNKGDYLVTAKASQPPMGVSVAAGAAWVKATSGTRNGAYHIVNDASVDITLTTADATNPRVDRIILRVADATNLGSATDVATLEVVTGTPTSGATLVNLTGAAAQPANTLNLAFVLVGAAVTSLTSANIGNLADPFGTAAGYAAVAGAVSGAPPAYCVGRPSLFTPTAIAYQVTAQSLTTATRTDIPLNTERIDNDGVHDNITTSERFIIKTPGTYSITWGVGFAANATGNRTATIRLNGTIDLALQQAAALASGTQNLTVSRLWRLGYGDYITAAATQTSGGALNTDVNSGTFTGSQELQAVWVGL